MMPPKRAPCSTACCICSGVMLEARLLCSICCLIMRSMPIFQSMLSNIATLASTETISGATKSGLRATSAKVAEGAMKTPPSRAAKDLGSSEISRGEALVLMARSSGRRGSLVDGFRSAKESRSKVSGCGDRRKSESTAPLETSLPGWLCASSPSRSGCPAALPSEAQVPQGRAKHLTQGMQAALEGVGFDRALRRGRPVGGDALGRKHQLDAVEMKSVTDHDTSLGVALSEQADHRVHTFRARFAASFRQGFIRRHTFLDQIVLTH